MTATLETLVPSATDAAPSVTIGVLELLTLLTNGLLFASKDGTLPVINSIRLELIDGYLNALATDRYRIGEFRFKTTESAAESFMFLLSSADAKRWITTLKSLPVLRNMKTRDIVLTLEMDGERLAWRDGLLNEASGTFQGIYGDYPKIRNIYGEAPATQDGEVYSFNPVFLADLCKVKDLTVDAKTEKNVPLRLVPAASSNKPINWLKGDWARGLLMLVRIPGETNAPTAREVLGGW